MNEMQDAIAAVVKMKSPTAEGWRTVVCAVCKDHKPRAAFKFETDGSVFYNCFNEPCSAIWRSGESLTFKFEKVLKAFGVSLPTKFLLSLASQPRQQKSYNPVLYVPHQYQAATLPDGIEKYDPAIHLRAKRYLELRCLDDTDYYVGVSGYWAHRLLIPLYEDSMLIGWSARSLFENARIPPHQKEGNAHLLYFPNGKIPEQPILVEGVFDAKSVPFGVAVLHSTISPQQAYLLRNTKPLLLPDRRGSQFVEIAKRYGWPLIIPKYPEKDANEALQRMGRLALALELSENIYTDFDVGRLHYKLWTGEHEYRRK